MVINKIIDRIVLVLLFAGLFSIIFVGVIKDILKEHDVNSNPRYTIGVTVKFWGDRRGGSIDFEYIVNKVKYKGSVRDDGKMLYPGGRYYVVYSWKNPEHGYLLPDWAVPDSIKIAPPNGWDKVPQCKATSNGVVFK